MLRRFGNFGYRPFERAGAAKSKFNCTKTVAACRHIGGATFIADTVVYFLDIETVEGKQHFKHAVIYRSPIYYV